MNARQRRKIRQRKVRTLKERVEDHLALCRLRGAKLPDRERLLQHLQRGGTIQDYNPGVFGFDKSVRAAWAKSLAASVSKDSLFKALTVAVATIHDEVGLMPRGRSDDLVDATRYLSPFPITKPDAVVKIAFDT